MPLWIDFSGGENIFENTTFVLLLWFSGYANFQLR